MWSCCAFRLNKPDRELAASLESVGLLAGKAGATFAIPGIRLMV
jgi:hypothetical protein